MVELIQQIPTETSEADKAAERVLVRRAQRHDLDAYDQLVTKYQGKIYGLIYHMTSNKEDAEDLTQDVFIKAYKSLQRFHGFSSFYTWVYRIAINQTLNFLKSGRRKRMLSLDDVDGHAENDPAYMNLASQDSPLRDLKINELHEKLNDSLQALSEKHRAVVVLHDVEGMPHEKVAKVLKVSCGTVRSRLFYARQLLQAKLVDYLK